MEGVTSVEGVAGGSSTLADPDGTRRVGVSEARVRRAYARIAEVDRPEVWITLRARGLGDRRRPGGRRPARRRRGAAAGRAHARRQGQRRRRRAADDGRVPVLRDGPRRPARSGAGHRTGHPGAGRRGCGRPRQDQPRPVRDGARRCPQPVRCGPARHAPGPCVRRVELRVGGRGGARHRGHRHRHRHRRLRARPGGVRRRWSASRRPSASSRPPASSRPAATTTSSRRSPATSTSASRPPAR